LHVRALQPQVRHQPAFGRMGELQLAGHAAHGLVDDRQAQGRLRHAALASALQDQMPVG
jgi:uncharacterized protein (DUF2249 family)